MLVEQKVGSWNTLAGWLREAGGWVATSEEGLDLRGS